MTRAIAVNVVYRAAKWASISDQQAEAIGPVFSAIEQRDGALSPRAVVDEARSESSPLHPYFEWDDHRAAQSYRIGQAKTLTRSVVMVEKIAAPRGPADGRTRTYEIERVIGLGKSRQRGASVEQTIDAMRREIALDPLGLSDASRETFEREIRIDERSRVADFIREQARAGATKEIRMALFAVAKDIEAL